MKCNHQKQKNRVGNSRGQIAIFVALVFQVLFVFFAMVINVGLLVHQKINLQNSVDIAAYYGAMKQAEGLNAVAHINYQIRQSWKLLLWRQKMLGMAGFKADNNGNSHPYKFGDTPPTITPADDSIKVPYFPANCEAYYPFDKYNPTTKENYCLDSPMPGNGGAVSIPIPNITFASGNPFLVFTTGFANATQALAAQAVKSCEETGVTNWYTMARYLAAHKMDVTSRKQMLFLVANGMSKETKDFFDVDGDSVKDGVVKTLTKNLSPDNREGTRETDIQFFNSLGTSECGYVDDKAPPKWLVDIMIYPFFAYMDTICSASSTSVNFVLDFINKQGPPPAPRNPNILPADVVQFLSERIVEPAGSSPDERLNKLSLGFEKNPWCMAYVGVSAKATPSIPFSPFGRITLTARAFAKPFGGRIGPWYGTTWASGASASDKGKKLDERVPDRVQAGELPSSLLNLDPATAIYDPNLNPNYSRFPGDEVGLNSSLAVGKWAEAIHTRGTISYNWWNQILEEPVSNVGPGDILAWDKTNNNAPPFRDIELAAISPDLFDTSYYSVEPDFYRNFAVRLEKRSDRGQTIVRGDLGSRKGTGDKLQTFGIKDQILVAKDTAKSSINVSPELKYHLLDFANLLTSWQGKTPEDYSIDESRFGRCSTNPDMGPIKDTDPVEKATLGNCRVGGRTGYSVKIIDEQYLKRSDLEIGGVGTSGSIINLVPSDF